MTYGMHCTLVSMYLHLFHLCANPYTSLQEVASTKGQIIQFKSVAHGILHEWQKVLTIAQNQELHTEADKPV